MKGLRAVYGKPAWQCQQPRSPDRTGLMEPLGKTEQLDSTAILEDVLNVLVDGALGLAE